MRYMDMTIEAVNHRKRLRKAFAMDHAGQVPKQTSPGVWQVPSQTFSGKSYTVRASVARDFVTLSDIDSAMDFTCTCADRHADCKHIQLVRFQYRRNTLRAFELVGLLPLGVKSNGMRYELNGQTYTLQYSALIAAWLRLAKRSEAA